ncbi:MAG TPA: hypothetical protein VGC60_10580, partial [Pyrinomonadaceae bacterium]
CKKILDYKIVHQERPEIANIVLRESNEPDNADDSKTLTFGWNHLDPGFGVKIQIIFVGTKDTEISIDGYVVGVPTLTDESRERIYRYLPTSLQHYEFLLPSLVVVASFVLAALILDRLISQFSLKAMISLAIAMVLGLGFGGLAFRKNRPPF